MNTNQLSANLVKREVRLFVSDKNNAPPAGAKPQTPDSQCHVSSKPGASDSARRLGALALGGLDFLGVWSLVFGLSTHHA